ncbi:MAG: hypothetical protein ABL958_15755 [Bdellovibrionia bacterium]
MEKEWLRPRKATEDLEFIDTDPGDELADAPERRQLPVKNPKKLEERVQGLSDQMNELSRLLALKTEKMSIKIRLLEERQQGFIEDFQKKLTSFNVRMSDKPRVDIMVQEIIEKHNQIVRTFENRLGQLKRVVENQEAELYKIMNELQEARRELSRLKR